MDVKINTVQMPQVQDIQKNTENKPDTDFRFTLLSKIDEKDLQQRLNKLIDNITVQGKKIADHMDVKDMKQYRSLISDFFNEVLNRSHKFSRENFLDRRGRHRVYGIVKLVNKDLDDLAQELVHKEKNHMNILGKVDEIRGLLMDILT